MPTLLLGVTGGIAAYKSVEVASRLRKAGWEIHVVMTEAATRFVSPLTFQGVSRHPVHVDQWAANTPSGSDSGIEHIDVSRGVDAFLVAPATAHTLARLAHGLADDLLTMTALATQAPLLLAPAMNPKMWAHPATRANLALLEARGAHVIAPAHGEMACGDVGTGRLSDVDVIVAAVEATQRRELAGRKVLVSAGGTREPVDPVRYLGNRSSGKMGHAVAEAARLAGAEVTLVTTRPDTAPQGMTVVAVETAQELYDAMLVRAADQDVVVMAAAVADYRPDVSHDLKRKKTSEPWVLTLIPNPDVLLALGERKPAHQLLVGFAAETGDPLVAAAGKLERKRLDLIVANDVSLPGQGFEVETNRVQVLGAEGLVADWPLMTKRAIGEKLCTLFAARLTLKARA